MSLQQLKIVASNQKSGGQPISKLQKLFNSLIKKIDVQKKLLLEWQNLLPEYNQLVINEFEVLRDAFTEHQVELVKLFDKAYDQPIFKKTDKHKIRHLICELSAELIDNDDNKELKLLHDKYSDVAYDLIQKEINEVTNQLAKNLFGLAKDDPIDVSSPESFRDFFQKRWDEGQEKARLAEDELPKGKKTAKQLQQEAQKQAESQKISQSIREVFRKLTSALHPDREPDADERLRKTELMQRVNIAYAKKDLLTLLELQMEIEQIDQSHINNMPPDRLKYIIKILNDQLAELEQEVSDIAFPFKMQLQILPFEHLTPQQLLRHLRQDIEELKCDIKQIQADLESFKDLSALKIWLKKYKIPKAVDEHDLLDFMYDDPDFLF